MKGQHRLCRLQVVNWGTFQGWVDLAVPRSGLLLTGPSGSGKSSLLDAMAAVLVHPKWLAFNAAAQEGGRGDRSRTLATYVRGAHKRAADEASGEVAAAYLRPGATWSAVLLTFDDWDGRITTLTRLMHLARGCNAASEVRSLYLLAQTAVDALTLAPFAQNGLDKRRLKQEHADWAVDDVYQRFAARLQRRLGLASDQAQHLLHKTQSAKNLDSLDDLLRNFMLDQPDTFELADQAIDQFQELRSAHETVVDARRQVERLGPLRAAAAERERATEERAELDGQLEHVETTRLRLHLEQAERQLQDLADRLTGLEREINSADAVTKARQEDRDAALLRVNRLGGDESARLEADERHLGEAAERVTAERDRQSAAAGRCGLELPAAAWDLAAFRRRVEAARNDLAETAEAKEARHDLSAVHSQARQRVERLQADLSAARRERSNTDPGLLAVRDRLVALGAPRDRLPFAGELLRLSPAETDWTGAVERVLRPFARTLLVPEDLYPLVSDFVDGRRLTGPDGRGLRLLYERVPAEPGTDVPPPSDRRALWRKLEVAAGEFADWLAQAVRRFDHACVETAAELRGVDRGVTRARQVRHSRTRHEKDDRFAVDDRRQWVLGSSTEARQQALLEALRQAEDRAARALTDRDQAETGHEQRQRTDHDLADLLTVRWADIDTATADQALTDVRARLRALRDSNAGLTEAKTALELAESRLEAAQERVTEWRGKRIAAEDERVRLNARADGWRKELTDRPETPDEAATALRQRFGQETDVEAAARRVTDGLNTEVKALTGRINRAENNAVLIMNSYRTEWPAQSADLYPEVAYLSEYLAILTRLEEDRLPDFEERFFSLLQSQARNNIGGIALRLRNARREIRERVQPINQSLQQTEYAPGHHLHIRPEDRRLSEVDQFLGELSEVTAGSLELSFAARTTPEERQAAERRFARLQALPDRLASSDPADRRWRTICLDSRLHVQFVAEVRDASGAAVDYYKGAGGLSGGERQKLVTFCLAAALRYQLARDGSPDPVYGLVVLDEAFDKTDPAFTRLGLEVFRSFGFQLLLATPEKMLQTLEDYVGGAIVVRHQPDRGSFVERLTWETAPAVTATGPALSPDSLFDQVDQVAPRPRPVGRAQDDGRGARLDDAGGLWRGVDFLLPPPTAPRAGGLGGSGPGGGLDQPMEAFPRPARGDRGMGRAALAQRWDPATAPAGGRPGRPGAGRIGRAGGRLGRPAIRQPASPGRVGAGCGTRPEDCRPTSGGRLRR
jgi:uncharacterized protein YPO0396